MSTNRDLFSREDKYGDLGTTKLSNSELMLNQATGGAKKKAYLPRDKSKGRFVDFNNTVPIDDDSLSKDFRSFQESIKHPLFRLGLESGDSPIDRLCQETSECLCELEKAIEDVINWRDELTSLNIPSSLKLDATVLVSRLFRSKSDLHQPLFELIRQGKLYSRTWNVNRASMLELEKDYHRHYNVLDVAIRKLEGVESRINRIKAQHSLGLWEKLALRILKNSQSNSSTNGKDGKPEENQRASSVQSKASKLIKQALEQEEESRTISSKDASELEWIKCKQAILDGIIDEPMWRLELRDTIRKFKTLLNQRHPGWSTILYDPHSKTGVPYLSCKSGTCRPKRTQILRRSSSLLNFNHYYRQEKQVLHYFRWVEEKTLLDERGIAISSNKPNPLRLHTRSNSSGALNNLEEVKSPDLQNSDNDIDQLHVREEMEEQVVVGQDEEDDFANKDIVPDEKYFRSIMTPQAQEAILKLVEANRTMDLKLIRNKDQMEDKNTFDLSEVMELTLLHAQQLHVMKGDFEERESIIQEEMERMCLEKDKEIEMLRQMLSESGDQGDQLAELATTEPQKDSVEARRLSVMPEGRKKSIKSFDIEENQVKIRMVHMSASSTRSGTSRKSIDKAPKKDPPKKVEKSFKDRNASNTPKGPRFKSVPFTLSFFERLDWFTKASIKYHERMKIQAQKQERKENERKLAYLNLISEEETEKILEEMPAEFMPMPGNLPSSFKPSRDSFMFSDNGVNGPWGGRFKIAEKAQKLNVLNLFDVALTLPKHRIESPITSDDETNEEEEE